MASEYPTAAVRPPATHADPVHTQPYTILQTRSTPVPMKFTWARQAVYPFKIGIRKDIYALGELLR
jgi:hypothetical protein